MKRILLLLTITFCYLNANVGQITALNGKVLILRNNTTIEAKKHEQIQNKDIVKSIGNSKAQIIFLDKTIITIGKNSTLNIKDYLFDNTKSSIATFGVPFGVFKTITGKIAKIAPKKFILKTNNATIGIRGTHFTGSITANNEHIACIKGAIVVTVKGKSIDVIEGEMINIKAGLIPNAPTKYKTTDLKNINSFSNAIIDKEVKQFINKAIQTIDMTTVDQIDPEVQQALYDKINSIQNENDKAASYNMYIDEAINEAYNQYSLEYTETYMDNFIVNQYQHLFEDDYTPLSFTYFTLTQPTSNSIEDILEATPFTTWRHDENTTRTPESKIVEYMGGINPFTDTIYGHWDGRSQGRKVTMFEGNIIGLVTNTNDTIDKVSIVDSIDNYSSVIIDFGNKLFYTYLTYNALDPITNELENWKVAISSADSLNVSSTGFYAHKDDFYELKGYNIFDASKLYQGRFYGDNLNQVSGRFQVVLNRTGESLENHNPEDTRFTFAEFVSNKNTQYDVEKLFVGEDEYFSWGYWSIGESFDRIGSWVAPKLENTPTNTISSYITQNQTNTYSGGIIGTYTNPIKHIPSMAMDGNFVLNMHFGSGTLDGWMELGTFDKDRFSIKFIDGLVNTQGFDINNYSYMGTHDIKQLEVKGEFFGLDAQKIGGGVRFETTNGDIGLGALIGTKN